MAEVNAEVIAHGIVHEAGVAAGINRQLVDALRTTLSEKGTRVALQVGAGREVNTGVADYVVNENIGIERGQDGKKQNLQPEEVARKNRIDTVRTLIDAYLQQGYDGLPNAQKDQARNNLEAIFNSYPAFQAILTGMPSANKKAFLERYLRNPQFLAKLEQKYLEVFDISKISQDTITQVNQETEALNSEVGILTTKITEATNKLDKAEKELQEFQVDVVDQTQTPPNRRGNKYGEILTINAEIRNIKGRLEISNQQLDILRDRLSYYEIEREIVTGRRQPHRGYVLRDISEIRDNINTVKGEISQSQTRDIKPEEEKLQLQQDRLEHLKNEEARLKEERKQMSEEKNNLEKQKNEKEAELNKKKQELAKLKAERRKSEDQFTQDIEKIFANASDEYINEMVNIATNEAKTLSEKQAQEIQEGRKKVLLEQLSKKYFVGNKISAELIRTDYNTLLTTGPDTIIESLLSSGGYSVAQITEAKNDMAFMEEMRQKVGESVVKYFLLRGGLWTKGGSMRPDEILKIRESPWGQNLIENALKGRDDLRNEINKALGRDVVTTGGKLKESFRNLNFETIFKILLFILGLGGASLFGISNI